MPACLIGFGNQIRRKGLFAPHGLSIPFGKERYEAFNIPASLLDYDRADSGNRLHFAARLMNIQIVDSEMYQKMLDGRYISTQTVKATRGEILDRNGQPLAVNRMGYDVVLDKAFLPDEDQNRIILSLVRLFQDMGEEWTDNLPISVSSEFAYLPGYDAQVQRLREQLSVSEYTSAEDVLYWLCERYNLPEDEFSAEEQRLIAGIRYEMEQRDFDINIPYTFATDIDISSVVLIKERSYAMPGVDVVESAIRSYPNGTAAPHMIGSIGPIYREEYQDLKEKGYAMDDIVGKAGMESAFEDILRGTNGQRQLLVDARGEVVQATENIRPVPGDTVISTLDLEMQLLLQDSLERQIKKLQVTEPAGRGREADAGAAVVIHVPTGEVLAAANYPAYDLNTYRENYAELVSDTALTPLVNRAIQGEYVPGSIFKPVVATAGLNYGTIDANSVVNCTRVYTYFSGYQPTCLSYHGNVNVIQALSVSCNIFFYDVGRRVGIDAIVEMATGYGLGQKTGIEISENIGQISSPEAKEADPYNDEPWSGGDVIQSSIGQLYNRYTPLQLANYAATIANRGNRMKVTLVHEVRDYTLQEVVRASSPEVAAKVNASPEVFETVIEGMVAASRSGSARGTFGSYPVNVAAKTGTPETVDLPNSTFICFAPAENPEIAIAVVIEKGWHGYTGAPVAKDVFDYWFGYSNSLELNRNTEPTETEGYSTSEDDTTQDTFAENGDPNSIDESTPDGI